MLELLINQIVTLSDCKNTKKPQNTTSFTFVFVYFPKLLYFCTQRHINHVRSDSGRDFSNVLCIGGNAVFDSLLLSTVPSRQCHSSWRYTASTSSPMDSCLLCRHYFVPLMVYANVFSHLKRRYDAGLSYSRIARLHDVYSSDDSRIAHYAARPCARCGYSSPRLVIRRSALTSLLTVKQRSGHFTTWKISRWWYSTSTTSIRQRSQN